MANSGNIIIVAQGGLANRMRAIASSLFYARKLNRDLIVVWNKNKDLNASFSELFKTENLPFEIIEPDFIKYNFYYELPRKRNLFLSSLIRKLNVSQTLIDIHLYTEEEIEEKIKRIKSNVIINSGLQFADFDHSILNSIFQFSNKVIETKKNLLDGRTPNYTIQIRRTDNYNSIKYSPLSSFEAIIQKHIDYDPKVLFFLATDDSKTKQILSSRYKNNIIINKREARRDTTPGMIDAAAELLIMSECEKIYGSYWSSFSEIAAIYGGKELIVVK